MDCSISDCSISVQRLALIAVCALGLGACAHHRAHGDDQAAPRFDVRTNAQNNLAYARDEAALWLTHARDRCAAGPADQRDECESEAQHSYENQVADAKRMYEQICAHEDEVASMREPSPTAMLHD